MTEERPITRHIFISFTEADREEAVRLFDHLEVRVDWLKLANHLGNQALHNSNGSVTLLGGIITARLMQNKNRRNSP